MDGGQNLQKKHSSLNHRLLQAMGMEDAGLTCGAVCVYPNRVAECVEALKRSNPKRRVRNWKHRFDPGTRRKTSQWLQWRLAFQVDKCLLPPGFRWLKLLQLDFVHHLFLSALFFGWNCIDMQEIKMAVADGAKEIDIVINRCFYYCVDWWTKDWELKQNLWKKGQPWCSSDSWPWSSAGQSCTRRWSRWRWGRGTTLWFHECESWTKREYDGNTYIHKYGYVIYICTYRIR